MTRRWTAFAIPVDGVSVRDGHGQVDDGGAAENADAVRGRRCPKVARSASAASLPCGAACGPGDADAGTDPGRVLAMVATTCGRRCGSTRDRLFAGRTRRREQDSGSWLMTVAVMPGGQADRALPPVRSPAATRRARVPRSRPGSARILAGDRRGRGRGRRRPGRAEGPRPPRMAGSPTSSRCRAGCCGTGESVTDRATSTRRSLTPSVRRARNKWLRTAGTVAAGYGGYVGV